MSPKNNYPQALYILKYIQLKKQGPTIFWG